MVEASRTISHASALVEVFEPGGGVTGEATRAGETVAGEAGRDAARADIEVGAILVELGWA